MINKTAYDEGVRAAWNAFSKTAAVPVMSFPKKPMVAPAMKPPVMGGAAAPAPMAAPAAAAPAAPPAGGVWKGLARDVGIQAAVPLAMMGVQNMMTPTPPKDPNVG